MLMLKSGQKKAIHTLVILQLHTRVPLRTCPLRPQRDQLCPQWLVINISPSMDNIATYSFLWHTITLNVYDVIICSNIENQNQVQDKQAITLSN